MYLSNYMKGYVVIIQAAEQWHTEPILRGIISNFMFFEALGVGCRKMAFERHVM